MSRRHVTTCGMTCSTRRSISALTDAGACAPAKEAREKSRLAARREGMGGRRMEGKTKHEGTSSPPPTPLERSELPASQTRRRPTQLQGNFSPPLSRLRSTLACAVGLAGLLDPQIGVDERMPRVRRRRDAQGLT